MTIMGCISSAGTIDISKRNPGVYKKILGASKAIRAWKGTKQTISLSFWKICWIKKEWKNIMLWWDNVRIHDNNRAPTFIEAKGYKPWFLPLYLSFLNSIEKFWLKVKQHIKRHPSGLSWYLDSSNSGCFVKPSLVKIVSGG